MQRAFSRKNLTLVQHSLLACFDKERSSCSAPPREAPPLASNGTGQRCTTTAGSLLKQLDKAIQKLSHTRGSLAGVTYATAVQEEVLSIIWCGRTFSSDGIQVKRRKLEFNVNQVANLDLTLWQFSHA